MSRELVGNTSVNMETHICIIYFVLIMPTGRKVVFILAHDIVLPQTNLTRPTLRVS